MSGTDRWLVVNADDFGQSAGINAGIVAAYERGIVTSTSLLVRWPAAVHAPAWRARAPGLGFGLHVDVCEWALRGDDWVRLYEVVPEGDPSAIEAEVRRQLDRFRELMACDPTHIDSHQHVHRAEPLRAAVLALGADLGVPVRHFTPGITYRGDFYGQTSRGQPRHDDVRADALVRLLVELPPGVTELACHPAADVAGLETMYARERLIELQSLCDARVRRAVAEHGIHLCTFAVAGERARRVG